MNPLISVIIPVYNTEKYVREAIESVQQQTYTPVEIICVNDGSTDKSLAVLASFGDQVTVIDCPQNQGISEARNAGVRVARGEYLAFLDADDVWQREKLTQQMERLMCAPAVDIVFACMQCFLSPELSDEAKRLRACPTAPTPGYIAGTALMKMEAFKRVGFFDPRWKVGEFIDWMTRAKEQGAVTDLVSDVLLLRRIHTTNTGIVARTSLTDYAKIAREALARKRTQNGQ